MKIEIELHRYFLKKNYTWTINKTLQVPSADDIRQAIDKAKSLLYDEKEPSMTCEIGHLILKKTPGHMDIYVHVTDEPPTN